ncbi:RNA-directed RNA polymerase [ssRNA phage SRR6960802_3]|uniref:RNA-directed RNA polymerase n=1 Tax=ssRNA phage SRR6960802_3 TaxID=2786609 RepID=A0A8S5L137_9VIRU|nr:RNA-directed RNA polymerase [ssRNA phage SRR6960802_3]DAD51053.1 TPA_asm: RNA-directed RNA polymerase [ssRNA phage SRR6960802_3]
MKSSKILIQKLITDCGQLCGVSVRRDILEVSHRIEHEGDSFLTITLPEIAEGLERALERGRILPSDFPHFKSVRGRGYPAFLQGFFGRVFDESYVRTDADISSIKAIRQISLFYKKIFEVCPPKGVTAQLRKFVEIDAGLANVEASSSLKKTFAFLFGHQLERLTARINAFELPVGHGPGATADRLIGNEKFEQHEWPYRLEQIFPFGEYCLPSWKYFQEFQPRYLDELEERPVKVTPVPKTRRKPRLIAIEPTAMQYAQQGIMRALVPLLERDPRSASLIGFTDQTPNQHLAEQGSVHRLTATIDLSDASDRVAFSLVSSLFGWWPDVLAALDASRSRKAVLPDGEEIHLKKFASMGSATCFPIEAMVFTAIAFDRIAREIGSLERALTYCQGMFRVYGDDIIVPTDYANSVVSDLEAYGLKVNPSKTFISGSFRESCGGDFYRGVPVNPVYLRVDVDTSERDARWFSSLVSSANLLQEGGLTRTAEFIRSEVEDALGTLPVVDESSSGLGWFHLDPSTRKRPKTRWNPKLQRSEVQTYVLRSPAHQYEIDGPFALLKTLTGDWSDPLYGEHLKASGRSSCVSMNKRWIRADFYEVDSVHCSS